MASSAPSSNNSFSFPSISFDNSLVEITALTTLIGTAAAASLALGTRGAAGLAWAPTSAFGIIGVIKACLSGACPGWLRETLGVRTKASDLAIGLDLDLVGNFHGARKVRKNLERPLGVMCDSGKSFDLDSAPDSTGVNNISISGSKRARPPSWSDVYVFDHSTSAMISGVPDTSADDPLRVFSYVRYNFLRKHNTQSQLSTLALSLLKLTEPYILWSRGSGLLALISTTPWCYFFIAALIIEARELRLARYPESSPGQLDMIVGKLPMISQPGGIRKVILGVARNPKKSWWWAGMWAAGAVLCTACIFMTYVLLGKQSKENIFIWAGFQAIWMATRLLIYHFADPEDPLQNRRLTGQSLDTLSSQMKRRVLEMILAISKYQTFIHPRGEFAYKGDLFSTLELVSFLTEGLIYDHYPTIQGGSGTRYPQLDIKAVIGDTTLSSAVWVIGSKLTPMDLYDSCMIIFSQPPSTIWTSGSSPKTMAIPAVRVLSGRTLVPGSASDLENDTSTHFVPKGSSNLGFGVSWRYWIPYGSGTWLQISTNEDKLSIVGKQRAEVLSDAEVSAMLATGTLNISFSHVSDIKDALEISRQAKESLLSILP